MFIVGVFIIVGFIIYIIIRSSKKKLPTPPYTPEFTILTGYDFELLELINNERVAVGLNRLIPERLLTNLCEVHCNEMNKVKKISHDNFQSRFEASTSVYMCENVAYNYSTANSLHHAYMGSEGHKKNILTPKVTHIGIYTENKYNTCLFARYQ